MFPAPYLSAQKTLRVWAVGAMIVCAAGSVVVGTVLLTSGAPSVSHHLFNVTFWLKNATLTGASGTAPLRTTTPVLVKVAGENITAVNITITWQDQSISPLFNPAVSATISGPNGTGASKSGPVSTRGTSFLVPINTTVPSNTTTEASNADDAINMAGGSDLNATLGSGDWSVSLKVGGPIGPRPGGSIAYTIAVQIEYFVGTAKPL
jgi:hypothetical protein